MSEENEKTIDAEYCDSCEFQTFDLHEISYRDYNSGEEEKYKVCNLCISTGAAQYLTSGVKLTQNDVVKIMLNTGNKILRAVKNLKGG